MINRFKTKIYYLTLSIFIILLDQLTKNIVLYNYKILAQKDFFLFRLDYVKNYGAAFNILNGNRIFLSSISIVFSIILLFLIFRNKHTKNIELYSYSFIFAGTFGNGIDRILNGYVIDFINLNIINFPVFNIADISINIGFFIILYSIFKQNK